MMASGRRPAIAAAGRGSPTQRRSCPEVSPPYRRVWFTSDLHIGHRLAASFRGFDEPELHDHHIADRWDTVVSTDDVVWVLGDISGGGRSTQLRALDRLRDRPGEKHLIAKNHDGVHPMHSHAHKMQSPYLRAFASVQQSASRMLAGQRLLMSHFPYADAAKNDADH